MVIISSTISLLPLSFNAVENLIPNKGITVIFGAPGEGKSFIRSSIAIACARGELLFGKYKTDKSKVLLVDKDNGMFPDLARFKMMGIDTEKEKITDNHLKGLRELIKDHKSIKKRIVISLEKEKRLTSDKIYIYPYKKFISELWSGILLD